MRKWLAMLRGMVGEKGDFLFLLIEIEREKEGIRFTLHLSDLFSSVAIEEKESVQPASAHEADKDLQVDYTTAGSEIPAHTPQPLSPLSGSIWCGAPAGNPIGEPAPGFHRSSFDCNRRE